MTNVVDQIRKNVGKGPYFVDGNALPLSSPAQSDVRLIAYYLPQFHSIPENDRWWGPGFTEWTNVTKAVPAYVGHQQPRLPADLGFYDLKNPEVIHKQADLARRAGIHGFCIHNYWFSGRRVLQGPLEAILKDRSIDLRFCLNWANESWSRRWDGSENDILLEQQYNKGDASAYAQSIIPAITDPRYIHVDGRPLLMFYRPGAASEAKQIVATWRKVFEAHGVRNPYVVMAHAFGDGDPRQYGIDAAAAFPPHGGGWDLRNDRDAMRLNIPTFSGHAISYDALRNRILQNATKEYRLFPGVCPSWDNEARKPGRGFNFYDSNPLKYGSWLRDAIGQARQVSSSGERIVFINAWNEWAEGAYLEPDQHSGYAMLVETRKAIEGENADDPRRSEAAKKFVRPHRRPLNYVRRFVLKRFSRSGG